MPTHRNVLVVLAAGAMTLGAASDAPAKQPRPAKCQAPERGFQSCLRVRYKHGSGDVVEQVRVTATLLRRVASCPQRSGRRTVVITRGGDELARARRSGRCAKGVVTWRARFSTAQTRDWELRDAQTVTAAWSGVRATNSVPIQPR